MNRQRDDQHPPASPTGALSSGPHGDPMATTPSGTTPSIPGEPSGTPDHGAATLEPLPPPSLGLLSFYDRLRVSVVKAQERRGSRLGKQTVEALLLVPDVFILMVRLALDPKVPSSSRAMIGGAIAYFVMPVDLLPEAAFGAVGYLDDLVLSAVVLSHALGPDLEPLARRHWSGSQELRRTLSDLVGAARTLLGANLHERLRKLLERRGISLEEIEREGFEEDRPARA